MRKFSKAVMETARNTHIKSKEQQRPVQRVAPMQTQQVPRREMPETPGAPSEPAAKMLLFLQNGEQRLITFTLPKESCTLQEVLEKVNVPFSEDTHIQCMQNTSNEILIDYFVSVGSTMKLEEMLEDHPMLVGDLGTRLVYRRAPEGLRSRRAALARASGAVARQVRVRPSLNGMTTLFREI